MRRTTGWIAIACCLALPSGELRAQAPDGPCMSVDEVADFVEASITGKKAAEVAEKEPLAVPDAAKALAPSSLDGLTIADAAGFLDLLGLAYEGGLIDSSDGRLTLTISPFALRAMANPAQLERQELYRGSRNALLRRINLTVSAGGQGESFDRDGDGKADDGQKAKELGDIVSAELKFRLWGSRDRRDARNFSSFTAAVGEAERSEILALRTAVLDEIRSSPKNVQELKLHATPQGGVRCDFAREAVAEFEFGSSNALAMVKPRARAAQEKYDAVAAAIDGAPELSLFASVVERKREFGTDSLRTGFRFSAGKWSANLDWTRVDLLDSEVEAETYRAAFEYSTLWLRGRTPAGDGISASAQGSYEKVSNVPGAKFDTTAKVGLGVEIPIAEGLSIPVGVTWANHRSLLDDADEARGHFGLKFNLESLWKESKKKE